MSVRPILRWPHPCLAEPAEPVAEIDDQIVSLATDMLETMYDAPGRGLAAPQIGVSQRIFVMDVTWKDAEPTPFVIINPILEWCSTETAEFDEGCLSLPGIKATITRPKAVRLAWTDEAGCSHVEDLSGIAARCALHEIDHLDGIVMLDRIDADARRTTEAQYMSA